MLTLLDVLGRFELFLLRLLEVVIPEYEDVDVDVGVEVEAHVEVL